MKKNHQKYKRFLHNVTLYKLFYNTTKMLMDCFWIKQLAFN